MAVADLGFTLYTFCAQTEFPKTCCRTVAWMCSGPRERRDGEKTSAVTLGLINMKAAWVWDSIYRATAHTSLKVTLILSYCFLSHGIGISNNCLSSPPPAPTCQDGKHNVSQVPLRTHRAYRWKALCAVARLDPFQW